jgi:translation initiation factor 4G
MNITNANRKKALLLHYAGEEVHDMFSTLTLAPHVGEGDLDLCKQASDALNDYFIPKRNKEYDIYKFRQSKQEPGESIDTYHTKLRKLAENCEFANVDDEIKSQIIQSCSSTRLRRRALRENEINLEQLLKLARSFEISEQQASGIEKTESAHAIHTKTRSNPPSTHGNYRGGRKPSYAPEHKQGGRKPSYAPEHKQQQCYNCGGFFPHKGVCPAKGKSLPIRKKGTFSDNNNRNNTTHLL